MYDTYVRTRNPNGNEVEILQDWLWLKSDEGNMWHGCVAEWVNYHSRRWFGKYPKDRYHVAIQAGGAFGVYPRMLAEKFEQVYTFEPTPASFHCLTNNCQQDNIIKIQAALGDQCQLVGLAILDEDMARNVVYKDTSLPTYAMVPDPKFPDRLIQKQVPHKLVQQLTIDSLNLQACDLIALDVETYEFNALKGAEKTIRNYHPRIVTEDGTSRPIRDFMKNLGYGNYALSAVDTVWIHGIPDNFPWDHL